MHFLYQLQMLYNLINNQLTLLQQPTSTQLIKLVKHINK